MSAYDLHGIRIRVAAAPAEIAERAAAGLHARLAGLPPDGAGPPDVVFEIHAGETHPFGRPAAGRPVYDPPVGEVLYDDGADLLYIGYGPRLSVLCEPGRGRARASAAGSPRILEEDLWALSHPLFTLPLVELLKRRGLYGLHAGGVCRNGRTLLLPGTSGSGKSTLTLALARAGFGFLGDDTLFLAHSSESPGGLKILAFPDELDLTDQTISFFPELAPLLDAARPSGWRKRQIRAEQTYSAEVVWECEPALLVFPRVAGVPESELTPMPPEEALLELAPNVLLTEPASSQAHFDVLAELVERSDCWRLATGTDLDRAVRLLEEL
ncbi:MAG TPA: hypothetical protein VHC97_10575 [Thermoanaerobaculia bacterium]|jgi:hypothetical protein|nr:hypothetical protein [Thermoanaerobaculia bacterium]